MSAVILSLFPGIGLLDRAFELEWPDACLVRGPDVLWGGDARRFHAPPGVFDGIIGGPPCQSFSRLRVMVEHAGRQVAANLIPEFERVISEAEPEWFLMENVPDAPEPVVDGYTVHSQALNNRWIGGTQNRLRRFSFGARQAGDWRGRRSEVGRLIFDDVVLFEAQEWEPAVIASGGGRPNKKGIRDIASKAGVAESLRAQGLPADFFHHSPFTIEAQQKVLGNGVPLPMGRSVARAVRRALGLPLAVEEIVPSGAAWVPCGGCDDFYCRIHQAHAYDCACPAIEEWGDVDPYVTGGPAELIGVVS